MANKKFELHAVQLILEEIVNINHREIYLFYENRYYVANWGDKVESNYDA